MYPWVRKYDDHAKYEEGCKPACHILWWRNMLGTDHCQCLKWPDMNQKNANGCSHSLLLIGHEPPTKTFRKNAPVHGTANGAAHPRLTQQNQQRYLCATALPVALWAKTIPNFKNTPTTIEHAGCFSPCQIKITEGFTWFQFYVLATRSNRSMFWSNKPKAVSDWHVLYLKNQTPDIPAKKQQKGHQEYPPEN